jgi:hypothetical protein
MVKIEEQSKYYLNVAFGQAIKYEAKQVQD